jgi:hypothetical protein
MWSLSLLILLAATPVAMGREPISLSSHVDRYGRSTLDLELEEFLGTAEIIKVEPLSQGVTRSQRVTLRRGRIEHRAIFKIIDESGSRLGGSCRDSYRYEAAAYRVDRLLGFGLVPVTVIRAINGKTGSVQLWIEDAMTLQDAIDRGMEPHNGDLLLAQLSQMYVMDALIYNADRNLDNVLVKPASDELYLIDHSRSFRAHRTLPPKQPSRSQTVSPSRALSERLAGLDPQLLSTTLSDLLEPKQIKTLLQRRDRLVQQLLAQ